MLGWLITDLQTDINKLKNERLLRNTLVELSEEEFSALQSSTLEKKFLTNEKLNILYIQKLSENASKRPQFIADIKEAERIQKEEEERVRKEAEAAERTKVIESQFSAWDGSHRNLSRVVKESMNDPDSYEHVETSYTDNGDHLIVLTKFRGKNGFGGTVLSAVKAKVSPEGDVLEILEQYP